MDQAPVDRDRPFQSHQNTFCLVLAASVELTCFPRLDFHVLAEASAAGRSSGSNLKYVLGSGLQARHSGRGVLGLQGGVNVLFVILPHQTDTHIRVLTPAAASHSIHVERVQGSPQLLPEPQVPAGLMLLRVCTDVHVSCACVRGCCCLSGSH